MEFGPQSVRVKASVQAVVPLLPSPVTIPLDVEFSPTVRDTTLVLRPLTRLVMLGAFLVPSRVDVNDLLDALRAKLTSLAKGEGVGMIEFDVPLDLMPTFEIDLATLSTPDFVVKGKKVKLPLEMRPALLIGPDALWILSEVAVK